MATKLQELNDPNSCLNRAQADEPLFVLRGNDPLAPGQVRGWAFAYFRSKGGHANMTPAQLQKYGEAVALADAMTAWKLAHPDVPLEFAQAPVQPELAGMSTERLPAELANGDTVEAFVAAGVLSGDAARQEGAGPSAEELTETASVGLEGGEDTFRPDVASEQGPTDANGSRAE